MMAINYLNLKENIVKVPGRITYFQENNELCNNYNNFYQMLPEEYNIFSDINFKILQNINEKQKNFFFSFINTLRDFLKIIYINIGIVKILPKLRIEIDAEDAIVLNLAYANYRIFFNFEKKINNSYYGIVSKNEYDVFKSMSGKLNEENYQDVIIKILQYILKNS